MAKHLASSKQNQLQQKKEYRKVLPKVVQFRPEEYEKSYERRFELREVVPVLAAVLLFVLAAVLPVRNVFKVLLYGLSCLAASFTLLRRTLWRVFDRRLPDEDFLIVLAVILAFCIKEFPAAAISVILYRFVELGQAYAIARSEGGVDVLRSILPEKARVERGEETEEILAEAVQPGDVFVVKQGEIIPVDGAVIEGRSTLNLAPLTGSEEPTQVDVGSEVLSGSVNLGEPLRVRALRSFENSAAARLIMSFGSFEQAKSPTEQMLSKYAVFYTPALLILAILIGIIPPFFNGNWHDGIRRAVVLLLISSPSALLISVPGAYLGALVCSARHGILIHGKDCVERFARVRTMVFGKTGAITDGHYVINDVVPFGVEEKSLLSVAAAAESFSRHPIAKTLKVAAGWTQEIGERVYGAEESPGLGISAFVEGRHVYVGNAGMMEAHGIWFKQPARAGAAIHVAVDNQYWGHIIMADKIRNGAFDAMEDLRAQGVDNMVLLTGDVLSVTRNLASSLNFDMVKAELSREGKISAIEYLLRGKGERTMVAYVGDGINDEELFDTADIGIALNGMENLNAIDSADLTVMDGDIRLIPTARKISSAAYWIAIQNILGVCAVKLILLLLGALGVMPVFLAAMLDAFIAVLASLNALRVFLVEK